MFFLLIGLISLLLVIATRTLWQQSSQLPGPWGFPVLGNLLALDARFPYKSLQNLAFKYGAIYQLRLGNVKTVVLADATLVREHLRRDELTARAPLFVTHGIMEGKGIVCAEGALWRDQRRQTIDCLKRLGMTKKLGMQRSNLELRISEGIQECLQIFQANATQLLEFDPLPALGHTLGNIINGLVFGIKYAQDDVTWRYLQHLQEEGVKLIGVAGVVNFLPFLRFLPSNKKTISFLKNGIVKTHEVYERIIADCEQRLLAGAQAQDEAKDLVYTNILECFLAERHARKNASDVTAFTFYDNKQLCYLLADLFGAGTDTTLTTLRWLLLFLAKNPKCQARLQKELCKLPIENVPLSELESIDYLKACISETLRIRSVVPMGIPHGTVCDVKLNGFIIPAKTMILPLQWAIHMNPVAWPDPEQYKPERFLDENGIYFQPQQFIPFQTGKRMCPGDELARIILQLYVGKIFRNFQVKLTPENENIDMEGECGITLTPPHYKIILKPNKN